jgi:hypothetical protein
MSLALAAPRNAEIVGSVAASVDDPPEDTVMGAGTESTGATVSTTSTVKDADAELPWVSLAPQVTVVEPSGNRDPGFGLHETGTGPSTRSRAVGIG